ncbi:MAG: beta-ketoacyl synthase [Desulfobacteraceae bacterium]|nr:beta-ketoacyl synthase [Desulfobacteraceae bacterium]
MDDNRYPVCIVGIGGRTPVGLNAAVSAASVRAAISRIGDHPHMIDKAGDPMSVAMVPVLPDDLTIQDRLYELALPGIREALTPLAGKGPDIDPVPMILGMPELRPGLQKRHYGDIEERFRRNQDIGLSLSQITILPFGHSAGLMAMEEGWKQILQGKMEFCLIGGVDSYMEPETLEWLDDEGQLNSGENRSGFPPGEGAGFCLLASERAVRQLKLNLLARVVVVATAEEENRIKTKTICIGKGLTDAISQATDTLKLPEEKINFTICDLNGERYRTEELVFTLLRTQSAFVGPHDYITPADSWGDVGAASGPLFAGLAVQSGLRGYAKGPRTLLWTSSEGGQRSAAILYAPSHSKKGQV